MPSRGGKIHDPPYLSPPRSSRGGAGGGALRGAHRGLQRRILRRPPPPPTPPRESGEGNSRRRPHEPAARVYRSERASATPAQRGRLRSPSTCAAYSTIGTILP